MKKFLLVLLATICVIIAGIVIFLMTFDLDKYRPIIIERFEKTTGKGMSLDKISFSFKKGLGINMVNLKIYPDIEKNTAPSLSVENGTTSVRLLPLLKKEVTIDNLAFTDPKISIDRSASGGVNIGGFDVVVPEKPETASLSAAVPADKKSGQAEGSAPPMKLAVSFINIKNGSLYIRDALSDPPVSLTVNDIDIIVKDVSYSGPMKFDVKMGIFSDKQNISANGTFISHKDSAGKLENAKLDIDMNSLDLASLFKTFPQADTSGLRDIKGALNLSVRSAYLDPEKIESADASFTIEDGKFKFDNIPSPFSDITMKATLKDNTLSIPKASLDFAEGTVKMNGTVKNINNTQDSSFEGSINNLSLTSMVPPPSTGDAYLSGTLSANMNSTSRGFSWPGMAGTINADGQISLKDGVINNMNILREVFSQISAIPGLVSNLESRLPEEYRQKLTEKHTALYPINVNMRIINGTLHCDDINVRTDHLSISGKLEIGLADQALGGKMYLKIGPELSNAFVKIVNELEHIKNSSGEIEIPVKLKGKLTNVEVIPDLNYLAKKIIATEVQKNVSDLLRKAMGEETAQSETSGAQQESSGGSGSSMMDLLTNALQKELQN